MQFRFCAAIAAACALAGAAVSAQQAVPSQTPSQTPPQAPAEAPPPTFRVEVNYVEVDAVVTDAQGNAVNNLTADDFDVLEDGKPQKVSAFSRLDLPIERTDRPILGAPAVEPDVQTNASADGRLYVLVLDDLHTTFTNTARVKAALHQFVDRYFGTNDLAAVVFTGQRSQDAQDFTGNRRLLLAAIDRFIGRNLPSASAERFNAYGTNCGTAATLDDTIPGTQDPCEAERGFNARNALSSIRRIADFMAGVRGRRKAMLWVSEGISYDVNDIFNNRSASSIISDTQEAIAAATRANVAIYAIDPRGLAAFDSMAIDSIPDERRNESPARGFESELQLSQDSLRELSDETGGFAATGSNDFAAAFARIVRENSSYYVLGYYPANSRRDGKYRKIEVRVKRPGLQVRSRKGYVAPRGRVPDTKTAGGDNPAFKAASEAMASPIPIRGLPLRVTAAAFKGAAPNATVAMSVDLRVDNFQFRDANGTFNDKAELTFTSTDATGKVRGSGRHTLALNLRPQTLAIAKERGLRIVTQMELPAGRYQVRVAIGEEGGGSGSVLYDLEVPDFYQAPLAMSGVVVTSAAAAQTPTVTPPNSNSLATILPGPPITQREFTRDDEIAVFAEFYENLPGAPTHQLDVTLQLKSADGGRIVASDTEQRSSTELQGQRGGYGFGATLPLKDIAPGVYVLHLEGRSRTEKGGTVSRDIQISVR